MYGLHDQSTTCKVARLLNGPLFEYQYFRKKHFVVGFTRFAIKITFGVDSTKFARKI